MKLDVGIEQIEAEVKDNILVIWSKPPLKFLSSAVLNGGLKEANGIINVQVPEGCGSGKNDVHWSAEDFLEKEVQKLQLPTDRVVGLMTTAKMQNVTVSSEKYDQTSLTVFVTAGATVAVTAGEPAASKGIGFEKLGTINIIVLVDGNLTDGCMVEVIKTVTEAKTVALREIDIRSQFSGDLATGTLTDSVAVGCTGKGEAIQYAGTFTMLGELIGKCVRSLVKNAIYKQEKLFPNRPLIKRLNERGITSEIIMSLLAEPKITCESLKYKQIKEQVEQILSDEKIASLAIASLRFDDDYAKGLIPAYTSKSLNNIEFEKIIQAALKDYLSDQEDHTQFGFIKDNPSNENLGHFTKSIFKAILKKAYSEYQ